MRHRSTEPDRTVKHPHSHFPHAGQLAGAAGQHEARTRLYGRAGGFQAITQQLQRLFHARRDDALQQAARRHDGSGAGVVATRRRLSKLLFG